jgi:hypothetical protein
MQDVRGPLNESDSDRDEFEDESQLEEGTASGGRLAIFAIAIAVVLGAVFYSLNSSHNADIAAGTGKKPYSETQKK